MATGRVPTTANSPLTAKGDLFGYSTTQARVPVGNDGETIVADSSTSTGLRYQGSQAAGKNYCINGGFDIWQRGTSSTTNGNYATADRWWMYYGAGTSTFSQEPTIVPTGSTYSLKIAQSVATNTNLQILQSIESLNAIALAGKTVTISGLFAASTSTTLAIDVVYSTSTNVTPGGSWTAATIVSAGSGTVSTTASFSRITGVYTIPSTAKSVMARVTSSSVASGTSVYVAQVQLEIGSVPTTFTLTGGTIQGELAACRRYLPAINIAATGSATFLGYAYTTNSAIIPISFDVPARVGPTGITTPTVNTSNFTVRNKSNGDATITSLTFDISGVNGATLLAGATLTTGDVCRLVVNNTSYILFTGCEL